MAQHTAHAVSKFLRSHSADFDIIEAPNTYGLTSLTSVATPTVVRLSSPAHYMLEEKPLKELEAAACRKAQLVIANSHGSEVMCRDLYSPLDTPVEVVHHGIPDVDPNLSAPRTSCVHFAYFGQAQLRKGTDLLIEALSQLPVNCGDFVFTFVRADIQDLVNDNPHLSGPWRKVLDRFGDRIRLTGTLSEEDKQRTFCEADVVVCPSRFESFGLMAAEAMRVGCTVIGSTAGGLEEVVSASPNNMLIPANDVASLVRAIANVVEFGAEGLRARRKEQRQVFLDYFHVDRMVEHSLDLYQRVLASQKTL